MDKTYSGDARSSGTGSDQKDAAAQIKSTISAATGTIGQQARQAADTAKNKGADQIAGVTRAVRQAADEISHDLPQAASYIHAAAAQMDQMSVALRERNIEEIVSSLGGFARRQPAAAFAGSLLAGFALSRFLKSQGTNQASNQGTRSSIPQAQG
jgi:hypothetical protein